MYISSALINRELQLAFWTLNKTVQNLKNKPPVKITQTSKAVRHIAPTLYIK